MRNFGNRADLLASLAFACLLCQVTHGSVKIFNPEDLKMTVSNETGLLDAGMANFGHIDYGTSIVSTISICYLVNLLNETI